MSIEFFTFLAIVGAITGTISLGWRILDEWNRLKITVNKFQIKRDKFQDPKYIYLEIDFNVSNISKKQNSITDIQLKISNKEISVKPDHYYEDTIPGRPEDTIKILDGVYRPLFDIPPGITLNKEYTFTFDNTLNLDGLVFELVLSDTYGKEKRKRLPKPTEQIISL